MDRSDSGMTIDELLRHQGWLQRMARHLVRGDAEDVVQDVWVQATERPPGGRESPRGWLATVLLNRVRSLARSDVRRQRRDVEAEVAPVAAATPEEVTARLELQRKLAAAMAALPEPYKQVIYLRYVEGREPAEIAAATGTPPGTVRWRIKEGLAKLRAHLDDEHGGKRAAWVAVLVPLAGPSEALARMRGAWVGAVAAGLAILAGWSLNRGNGLTVTPQGAVSVGAESGTQTAARSRPPVFTPGAFAGEDAPCPEVTPMRVALDELKLAVGEYRNVRDVFHESAPNPKLEQAARPIVEAMFAQVKPGCEHSLSCRGMVCEVLFLTPDGFHHTSCWPKTEPTFHDYLSSGMSNLVDSGTPFHDPVNGKSYLRQSQMWRFYRDDAQPVPRAMRPPLPDLQLPTNVPAEPPQLARARVFGNDRRSPLITRRSSGT